MLHDMCNVIQFHRLKYSIKSEAKIMPRILWSVLQCTDEYEYMLLFSGKIY